MLKAENALFTIVMLLYFAAMILYFLFIATKKDGLKDMTAEQLRTLITEVYDKLIESTAE